MAEPKTDQDLRQMAERRVDAKFGFRVHATVFVLVNTSLAVLNLLTSPQVWWFLWPLGGWGIGLAAHGWAVYGNVAEARDKAIAKELQQLRDRYGEKPPS